MKMKTSVLAAAMTAALATGLVGEAAATEYAISRLFIDSLTLQLSDDGGATAGGGSVTQYTFNTTNTAFLDGAGGATNATCSGPTGSQLCGVATPVLNAAVINATGSTVLQGENTFTQNGPGAGSYANADSVILTSQLTMAQPTSTRQIAEAQIQPGNVSASSSTEVSSTTGFSFTFEVAGADQMTITMDALLKILADINDPTATGATAQANTELEFKLSNDSTGIFASFKPNGSAAGECLALGGGLTCTTLSDEFDLNTDVSVSTLIASSSGRFNDGTNDHFSVIFGGLTDGTWTLLLTAKTSTLLSRSAVPEPGVLALLGIGLAGLGAVRRRSRVTRA